jgi:lipopolysaccharide transport system permease protein
MTEATRRHWLLGGDAAEALATAWRYRRILRATTLVELQKKFAGSVLGTAWIVLQPLLFLLIYLFLFLVVFRVRFPGMSDLGYGGYVFAGLVPYLALMEALGAGAVSIKQNIHLVRNVIVPIDLIPMRLVLMAMATELVGLAVVIVLLALDGRLSPGIVALPLILLLQLAFLLGLVYLVASFGVVLPDLGHAIGLVMIFLMFISPIGFKVDMLPPSAQPFIWANPVTYMLEAFRSCLIADYGPDWRAIGIFAAMAILVLFAGTAFFRRFKGVIVDYE